MEYHKINSIYKRDMSQKKAPFIIGQWADPVFDYLQNNQWEFSEKIDGTNIRVYFDGEKITFGGRTDNAQIPANLVTRLNELFLPKIDLFKTQFSKDGTPFSNVIFYGEGFGNKIQSGGDYFRDKVDFCLFDIRIGDIYLRRYDVYSIADMFGLLKPKVFGYGTIQESINLVKTQPQSAFGTAKIEGFVLRPKEELLDRQGHRIITKIKVRDFDI